MTTDTQERSGLSSFFIVVRSGSDQWGNVFLTSDWRLYVDMTSDQHDRAMLRLGIDSKSVLVSGCAYTASSVRGNGKGGIAFRSSPGEDRMEISNRESRQLMAAITSLLLQRGDI